MNGWSREEAISMQRRHILEGEHLVAKQQALVEKLIEKGHHGLVETANELLGILRESLELSRTLLQRCRRVGILREFGAKGFRFSCRERIMPFKILWGGGYPNSEPFRGLAKMLATGRVAARIVQGNRPGRANLLS